MCSKSPQEVRNAIAYVVNNIQKHTAKKKQIIIGRSRIAQDATIDGLSSGVWFDGFQKLVPIKNPFPDLIDVAKPIVATARAWLLKVGWKNWGLIDPVRG